MKKIFLIIILVVNFIEAKPCMTDIYFGNGVWNLTEADVIKSRNELKSFMQFRANSKLDISNEGVDYEFKHAYNPSRGDREDLMENFYQLKESGQISNGFP